VDTTSRDGRADGHVHDFIIDDETWEVRYLVIDTSNWWLDKKVLVFPALGEPRQLGGGEVFVGNVSTEDQEQPRVEPVRAHQS